MAIKLNGVDYAPDIHLINETLRFVCTAANTLEWVEDLTVTIPANSLFVVTATAAYNNAAGRQIAIADQLYSGVWSTSYIKAYNAGDVAGYCSVTYSNIVTSRTTLYFAGAWASTTGTTGNELWVRGFYIPTASLN